jgi:hypothetical protein
MSPTNRRDKERLREITTEPAKTHIGSKYYFYLIYANFVSVSVQ